MKKMNLSHALMDKFEEQMNIFWEKYRRAMDSLHKEFDQLTQAYGAKAVDMAMDAREIFLPEPKRKATRGRVSGDLKKISARRSFRPKKQGEKQRGYISFLRVREVVMEWLKKVPADHPFTVIDAVAATKSELGNIKFKRGHVSLCLSSTLTGVLKIGRGRSPEGKRSVNLYKRTSDSVEVKKQGR